MSKSLARQKLDELKERMEGPGSVWATKKEEKRIEVEQNTAIANQSPIELLVTDNKQILQIVGMVVFAMISFVVLRKVIKRRK